MSGFDFMKLLEPIFFREIPEHRDANKNETAKQNPEIVRTAYDGTRDCIDGEESEEYLHHRGDEKNDCQYFYDFVLLVRQQGIVRVANSSSDSL